MKKIVLLLILLVLSVYVFSQPSEARRGCCSHHKGVCGCQCCDGTPLSAKCAPYYPSCRKPAKKAPRAKVKKETKPDGFVVSVTDGDTIKVMLQGKAHKVRLYGVDCPETGQPFADKAKQFTKSLSTQKIVTLKRTGKDRYGRILAWVILPDGRSLNQELVKYGLAWWYKKYAPSESVLKDLEAEARKKKYGLWSVDKQIAPWDWRRGKRK